MSGLAMIRPPRRLTQEEIINDVGAECWSATRRGCQLIGGPKLWVLVRVPTHEGAHDFDDAFLLEQYEPGRVPFDKWLSGLTWKIMVCQGRVSGRFRSTDLGIEYIGEDRICDPAELCEMADSLEQLWAAMAGLRVRISEEDYRIVYNHWFQGKGFPEIAVTLNLDVKQVRDHHDRAKRKLGEILSRRLQDWLG